MPRQQVDTPQDRLKRAVRRFVKEQETTRGPNDATALRERAANRLGWTETRVKTLGGWKVTKTEGQLPHLSVLRDFCRVTDDSADYILFGDGAPKRETRAHGGKLSSDELASELAAHLVPLIRNGQTQTIHALDGREALRAVEIAALADRDFVQADNDEWLGGRAAEHLLEALPRISAADRVEAENLAHVLKASAARRQRERVQRVRARSLRIVVDFATLNDRARPVYRAEDRMGNRAPPWLVKVGQPPD